MKRTPGTIWISHAQHLTEPRLMVVTERGTSLPLHRVRWEAAHGPVGQGGVLVFRDGDWCNCSVGNIERITRAQHALRSGYKAMLPHRSALMKKGWRTRRHREAVAASRPYRT